MSTSPLRIEQFDTVYYNTNLNPMGIPETVKKALSENIDSIIRYPIDYYSNLKKAIAEYVSCAEEHVLLGNGLSDLLRLCSSLIVPKKALLLKPSATEYENVLNIFGAEIDYYDLDETEDFKPDVKNLATHLDSSYDMLIIGNPSNPTSQLISREDMSLLADACKQLDIFLIIDEMYIEFTEDCAKLTSIPLTLDYDNIVVLRSVSKFFAVPGLRLAYAIMNNPEYKTILDITSTPNNVSTLTAAGCIAMFKDEKYISESRSIIHTERSLIYSAMSTNKNIKLYKPYANFMLARILKDDVYALDLEEHCKIKGLLIRNCDNIRGLDNKYIRFCFMNPKQNDLLVNTLLELL